MLDAQYHLYSVDTGHFYSNREMRLHEKNCRLLKELSDMRIRLKETERKTDTDSPKNGESEMFWNEIAKQKRSKAKKAKEDLSALLSRKAAQNERTRGADHVRRLREESLTDACVISAFESALSRAAGIKSDELTDALFVVQVYFFDVFKDISYFGFLYRGEKYIYFTSSAGQIRKKKAVFMKESVFNRIETTVMCGLTADRINARGGNNVNKHLAYMALSSTATDEWKEFDIDRAIVIDDFETEVFGEYDFVDESDYSVTRKKGFVPVPHTDGAGMMLPCVSTKNFMFRAPWIKGLLGVFDFRRFIAEHGCSPVIRDIYGKKRDVLKEKIEIIFTKSQFKMYRYYDSWEEYREYFKQCRCSAGRCNIEEDRVRNAKTNYQMLQTLTDVTDEEAGLLAQKSADRIQNICSSKEAMMDLLGISPYHTSMTPFQKAVKLYPALLNDTYAKDVVRDVKNSLLKKYRGGKLEIYGKYAFLLPDYYAACEYWFEHKERPKGLLADGEVFCRLFPRHEEVDCVRSPHLYKEHAVRKNIASDACKTRAGLLSEWFVTNGLYASSHDLISKLLMYDVDGDQALVIADPVFVKIAKRNMDGIVPLYYNMRKARPQALSKETIYSGLSAAFTGANIGMYSNHISKIWNDDVFFSGTEEEKQDALDCVKRLCCQNNFVIDFAKTLYKPEFPPGVKKQISKYTNAPLPAFFVYAKDKDASQTAPRNNSLVNRIYGKIPNPRINTRGMQLGDIEPEKMMRRPDTRCPQEVARLYDALNKKYRYRLQMKDGRDGNLLYLADKIREEFGKLGYSEETVADMLVSYLYRTGRRYKQLFWFCYGSHAAACLEENLKPAKTKALRCGDCGEWFEAPAASRAARCKSCAAARRKEQTRLRVRRCREAGGRNAQGS